MLCLGKRAPFHLCKNMKDTCTFKSKNINKAMKLTRSRIVTQKWQYI